MKVLHLINSLDTGGAEKLLLDTLPLYREKGIDAQLLLLNGSEHQFVQQLRKSGLPYFSLGKGSVYNPLHVFRLIGYLKKFDIVHVHLFPSQYWAVFAKILSFSKTKLVFTEHNTSNRRLENPIFRIIDSIVYKFYTRIVCISPEIRDMLIKHTGLPENRFVVITNGVDISAIQKAQPIPKTEIHSSLSNTDFVLLQVAAFREQKDQKSLIQAMPFLPENVKLLLVGDGSLRTECENLTSELKLENRVFFLGKRLDVAQLLKSADAIVLSSHYEGVSLSSIEGMASGKPFVASDVPGLKEVVQGAGILVHPKHPKALADAISKLQSDKNYRNAIAESCQKRASEFDISHLISRHIALYESLA